MRGRRAAGAVVIAVAAFLATAAAFGQNRWGAGYFPNVELVTQDGNTVRFYDDLLKGKAVAVNTMYTSCKDECPLETARLVQVQRLLGDRMGKDIFFYSITTDPKRDKPEVLKAYAEKFGVGPGWLFLTGNEEDLKLVIKKLGLAAARDLARRDGHSPSLMVGNEPTGQWMRNSAVDNPKFLVATIGTFMGWRDPKPGKSYAEARPLTLDRGGYVFQTRCVGCHTIGKGDVVGPDLAGVTSRRERAWLVRYVAEPDRMLAEGDPTAIALFAKYKNIAMPNLGLGKDDAAAVLSYIEAQGSVSRESAQENSVSGR